ncbi:MAG: tetratricopeptide repeat protein [Candidatus Udaeobacter sp.]
MKRSFAFILITALTLCLSQVCQGEAKKKDVEANKLAREGAEAAKSQDWDKAVELLRKASAMDHKYANDLTAVYQQRGYAEASNQQFQDAINDYNEAAKLTPQDVRIYEQRAAVEMKIEDYDKALADYSEIIKLKPNDVRYYNYRAYIYEIKNDVQNAIAETERALKVDPNNQEAKDRKQRIEQKVAANPTLTPPPTPTGTPKPSPHGKKKP